MAGRLCRRRQYHAPRVFRSDDHVRFQGRGLGARGRGDQKRRGRPGRRDRPPPRQRPHVCHAGGRGRGSPRADRHRRAERPAGRLCARRPARLLAAGRRPHQKGQAARRRILRDALLPFRAGPHNPRLPLRGRGRHLHPGGTGHEAGAGHPVGDRARRRVRRVRDHLQPPRLPLGHRARARGGRHLRKAPRPQGARGQSDRRRHQKPPFDRGARPRPLPPLHGADGQEHQDRPFPPLDAGAAARLGRAPHQQHRRHHQLRHARIRPADARVRLQVCRGRQDRRPQRQAGRDDHDPRRGRPRPLPRDARHRGREEALRRRGRHGRRIQRHHGRHQHDRLRVGLLQRPVGAHHRQKARHAHRGVRPL